MGKKNEDKQEYATLRVTAETARKTKVLSGLWSKTQIEVMEDLVDKAFREAVSLAAEELD